MNKKFHLWITFFCLLVATSIYSEEAEKIDHSKNAQELPELKYETGDITIDLKIEAERLKKSFDANYRLNKNHILNSVKENLIVEIEKSQKISENYFLNGNYKESRRSYKKGFTLLDQFTKDQSIYYKERFKENIEYLNLGLSKLKNYPSPSANLKIETSEKKIREGMLLNYLANNNFEAGRYTQSFDLYKSANLELLESIILVDKELIINPVKESEGNPSSTNPPRSSVAGGNDSISNNNSSNTKNTEKKFLDEDYLNMASKKDWDDILGKNHKMEEVRREIERKKIEEFLAIKASKNNPQAKQTKTSESTKPNEPLKTNEPAIAKEPNKNAGESQ